MRRSAPSDDHNSILDALEELLRAFESRDRELPCYGDISITECKGLQCLTRDGAMTVNELARVLRLNKSTASRAASSLERKGYVRRSKDPRDRRSLCLAATVSGRTLERRIREAILRRQGAALASLTPEVRRMLPEALRRLAAAAARPGRPARLSSK
ncbi:MAG: MarR family winged helix-turn-helix transcriptional regulator [Thermoanaerobaculia bacterium]